MTSVNEWNRRYQITDNMPSPCQVLAEYVHLLPRHGKALDLACGLGAHALLLARHGLETHAWDFAENAIQEVEAYAQALHLPVHTQVRDVIAQPPPAEHFDVIVVCRFLERSLMSALIEALKPNGLLFYQTFIQHCVDPHRGPKTPQFRLADNELLNLFKQLQLVVYREEGVIGDVSQGFRNEALLIGRKVVSSALPTTESLEG